MINIRERVPIHNTNLSASIFKLSLPQWLHAGQE